MADEMRRLSDAQLRVGAAHFERARRWRDQTGNEAQQARLAGAVGTGEQQALAGGDLKRHILEHGSAAAHTR